MTLLLLALAASVQGADTLTLEQALSRALGARPRVAVAAGVIAQARGASRVLGQVPNPTLQLDWYDAAPDRKVYLTQSLNWLLRHTADRGTGRALVDRARADSTMVMAGLAQEVRRSFVAALAGRQELALAVEHRELADSLLVLADRRLALGDIAAFERDQVAQVAGVARQSESIALETERVAALLLRRAVGGPSQGTVVPRGALDQDLGSANPSILPGTPPALVAVLADSAAAAGRLRSARLGQIPPVSLRAGQESGGDGVVAKAFLGFSIAVPIFNRGGEAGSEAAGANMVARGLAAEARLEFEARAAEATIRLEQAADRAITARDSMVPGARRLRAGAVRRYEQGRTGILPVFEAIRAEREVLRGMIQALVAFQNARADLLALFGRWT